MKDFRDFLSSGAYSDVRLEVVVQDPQSPAAAPARATRKRTRATARADEECAADQDDAAAALNLHAIVLRKESAWADTMLSSGEWAEAQQRRLRLEVASGAEADAVRSVVEAMYAAEPQEALAPLDQGALLQVLRMSDRLQAPEVTAAAGRALAAMAPLDWPAALAVWALPAGCADCEAYRPAYEAAAAAARRRYGDLDVALNDAGAREELLTLPLAALVAVLGHDSTRAASENTVYAVADMWLHDRGGGSDAERAALSRCVRCMHCTPGFLAGVVSCSEWLARDAGVDYALLHAVLPPDAQSTYLRRVEAGDGLRGTTLHQRARRASTLKNGRIAWDMPVSHLARLFELAAGGDCATLLPRNATPDSMCHWGGCSWGLTLLLHRRSGGRGWFVQPSWIVEPPPSFNGGTDLVARLEVSVVKGSTTAWSFLKTTAVFNEGRIPMSSRGQGNILERSQLAGWDEAAWRAAGLLDGDALRLRGKIVQVF